ncbi:MAG: SpoIIE family protein phosphatase [Planctomycetes bacterium]|nr:SpoIIE family protein phosphatase [Planctomycetota bacterium]
MASRLRLPIAVKFALPIMLLAVAAMAWQARTAIQLADASLEAEINTRGIQLVTSLSILLGSEELAEQSIADSIIEKLRRFEESAGMSEVRHVVVYDSGDEQTRRAIAMVKPRLKVTSPRSVPFPPALEAGVSISEFKADGVPVRSFTKGVVAPGPEQRRIAVVELFLSAQHIADSRERLSAKLIQVSLLACLFATIASFFVATFLTRGIRTLVKDLRQVSQGDLNHQSALDSADELGDMARTFNLMTSNLLAAQETKLAQKAMEQELSVAMSIQSRLLPSTVPSIPGIDVAIYYQPAKEVGGDYYDFLPIDEHHLGIVIADVSGKGVPGSLVMTMTRSLLRMAAAGEAAPDLTVREVNRCLSADMNPGMFVTLLYLVLNTSSREVRLVRAGHNAPLLFRASQRKLIHVSPRGIAIGLDHHGALFDSELEVQKFGIEKGDVLVAFTDGVTEAKSPTGEDFGEQRLYRLIGSHHSSSAQILVDSVVSEIQQHQGEADRSDDISLLVLRGI